MRKVNAIIFDLDGTLVYFKIEFMCARRDIIDFLSKLGIPKILIPINQSIMKTVENTEIYLKKVRKQPNRVQLMKTQVEKIISSYEMEAAKITNLIPGAKELLHILKSQKYKLGLFTLENRITTDFLLERFSIKSFFDSIVTRDDVDQLKPNPAHLSMVLKQLNISPNEIIVIGDSPIDFECAKKFNAITIALLNERHTEADLSKAGADYIIDSLLKIYQIIENINKKDN